MQIWAKSGTNCLDPSEETTTTQLDFLLELLHQEKTDQPQIIGRGLFDREPVIIHHFFGVQNKAEDYRTGYKYISISLKGKLAYLGDLNL